MFDDLSNRIASVQERIERARRRSGGSAEVRLVVVTKTFPAAAVEAVVAAGIEDVGENRVQELQEKVEALGRGYARWHFVGRLQRNKAKLAVPLADLVQSVDSMRLAERLSRESEDRVDHPLPVLVQVNTSGEEAKGGLEGPAALEDLATICALPGLRVEGLMTMAPFTDEEPVLRRTFRGAKDLFEAARDVTGFRPLHLSMGMTNDYEIAVEEGSTMVRIGTAILGERSR